MRNLLRQTCRSRQRHGALFASKAVACIALASCSTQTPQVFSDNLLTRPALAADAADSASAASRAAARMGAIAGDISVETAIAEAQTVQRQYLQAVKDLSEVGTGTSAALIALTAVGLGYASGADLARLGVLGGATYAYGTTLTSRPRQQLFLTGAEALNCAIGASRPYALPKGWLRAEGVAAQPDNSLEGLAGQADAQARALARYIDELNQENRTESRIERIGKPAPPDCSRSSFLSCTPGTPATADRQRAQAQCLRRLANEQARCASPVERERAWKPSPEVPWMLTQLSQQRRHLLRLAATARQQVTVFGGAGNALWETTVATQVKVAREVLKTEPDLATVLAAAQGIKATAFALTSAPQFQPAAPASGATTGKAQSAGKAKAAVEAAQVREAPEELLAAARAAIEQALLIGDQMQARLDVLNQRAKAARVPLERCGQGLGEGVLAVSPDVTELTLAPGQTRSFLVTGGTGNAQGVVLSQGNAPSSGLSRSLDGAFVYRVPDDAPDASTVILRFTDGGGRLSREVTVHIARSGPAAGAVSVDIKSLDLKVLAAAVGLSTAAPNDKKVAQRVESCLQGRLGVSEPKLDRIDPASLAKVLAGACRG